MKKTLGFVVAWILCYLGHWVSKVMGWTDAFWLYNIYNWFMTSSHDVQMWSGTESGPWYAVENDN